MAYQLTIPPEPFSPRNDEAEPKPAEVADARLGIYRAGMLYIAADLQRVARFAPPAQASQVLALSRLVATLGRSQEQPPVDDE
ncbi:MAG: hypothetical protein WAS73_09160 [Defluviicoccus sp.]